MEDYQVWLPIVVSFGALVFSFLNFRRGKRIENENHIYRLKIDLYSKFISEFVKLINSLQTNVSEAKRYLESLTDEGLDKLNDAADKIDEICLNFDDFLVSNSLIIPEKILYRLNKFSSQLLDTDPLDEASKIEPNAIKKLETILEFFIKEANEIGMLLRKDIHVDKLNSKLQLRLK